MTIAIVATFAAIPATPAALPAGGIVAADERNSTAGFASILLGLPAATEKPPAEDDIPPSGSETTLPDASPAGSEPPILATLGLPPPPFASFNPEAATGPTTAAAQPASTETLQAPAPAAHARLAHDLHGSDPRSPPPTRLAIEGKAAKLAVADSTAPLSENASASQPEPAAATSNLSTLSAALAQGANGAANTQEPSDNRPTSLRDPSWASEFGQKLLWFAANDKQLAQLTLHPPQLGSIEITLNLDKDGANAHFVSTNAEVRGAIESAVPRLREMFASAGIELGQVSVGDQSFRQQPDGQREQSRQPRPPADNAILGSDSASHLTSTILVTHRGQAMIDTFA